MAVKKSTEIEKVSNPAMGIVPFGETPDHLAKNTAGYTGMEDMGKDDVKTPQIVLLQAMAPQIKTFAGLAIPGQFWHTGMNVSLGTSFDFVPALAAKRIILFRPREDGDGGILAFSKDGKTWQTGGNQRFTVRLKGKKEPVIWETRKDVLSSGLTNFGTQDPDDPESPPAATISYEYLCYLPAHPELSPCVLRMAKTALPTGKSFNTSLAMIARQGKPIWSVGVRATVEEKQNNLGAWTIPNLQLLGWVPKPIFEAAQKMSQEYSDYNIDYSQDEESNGVKEGSKNGKNGKVEDEIPF